jgi:hypothetical protein
MKQIIQDLKNGNTLLEEVPVPQLKAGAVIIRTTRSLVSLGTERMLVEFGKASLHNGHSEEFRQSAQGDIISLVNVRNKCKKENTIINQKQFFVYL